ncbi:BLUF domain-containing protein [Chitinibacter bivalviorum]|uniref:BLUF domain-containing protein n=1 Tax=Chitinibacter bivalviorum TaxID=2739434 RepID=A0A7H9BJ94_9NEIS|nr:BLUF domain-containing protein [Chitinibacter bivalviorum]QLG88727.1 BLUF domain-containing protein [Chitinibacter bivalviorum]
MLVRLIYASRAAGDVNAELLDAILRSSRQNNPAIGVTGVLCYSGGMFVQVLEGSRSAVSSLYNVIVRDPRHEKVELLHFEEIVERHFSGWTMGQVNLSKVNACVLLKYSARAEFNPFEMSGSTVMRLLDDLIATAAISK